MLELADKDFKLAILTMPHMVKMVIINENIFLITLSVDKYVVLSRFSRS